MAKMKLNTQDKKDLDKYIKFLALKSIQIVVESRSGEKVSTPCKPHANGPDWFNLNIVDISDVLSQARNAFNSEFLCNGGLPLYVEFSLRTREGDDMILEYWCLRLLPETCDAIPRLIHTIYNRMGILLKSLVSVTRVLPAYKLSRTQGSDSYVILYKISMAEPSIHQLGDGFKKVTIGQICTPIGTLELSVSYRTKMMISPTQTGRDNSIMLKSDHFNTNLSPRNIRYKDGDDKNSSLGNPMKIGAFANFDSKKYQESEMILPNAPFSKLFISPPKDPEVAPQPKEEVSETDTATTTTLTTSAPSRADVENHNSPPSQQQRTLTMMSTNDDFIMVDLKTPFASTNANSELNKFYREWSAAPPLKAFIDMPPLEDLDITKQLETYESDLNEYDTIVNSLCFNSPSNNN